jgi:hypothetical protein
MIIIQFGWLSSNMDDWSHPGQLIGKIDLLQTIYSSREDDVGRLSSSVVWVSSRPSWMIIVLRVIKLAAIDECRSHQMNIICCSWISSVYLFFREHVINGLVDNWRIFTWDSNPVPLGQNIILYMYNVYDNLKRMNFGEKKKTVRSRFSFIGIIQLENLKSNLVERKLPWKKLLYRFLRVAT